MSWGDGWASEAASAGRRRAPQVDRLRLFEIWPGGHGALAEVGLPVAEPCFQQDHADREADRFPRQNLAGRGFSQ